jgi:hypothetical protein
VVGFEVELVVFDGELVEFKEAFEEELVPAKACK